MTLDQMPINLITNDQILFDQMTFDQMTVNLNTNDQILWSNAFLIKWLMIKEHLIQMTNDHMKVDQMIFG